MDRRNFLKLGVVAAAACAGVAAIPGCSDAGKKASEEYGTRTVRVATSGNGEPFSYVDSSNKWTGYCADVWKRVEEITKWKIEVIKSSTGDSAFGDMLAGKADVVADGFYITPKRLEYYLACDPLLADAQVVAVSPESGAQSLEDLHGGVIGVVAGRPEQATVNSVAPSFGWKVKPYNSEIEGLKDCAKGDIAGFVDKMVSLKGTERAQHLELRVVGDALGGNNIAWFTLDNNKELRDVLNKVIKVMHEDGSLAELSTKWFRADLTSYISDAWPVATE